MHSKIVDYLIQSDEVAKTALFLEKVQIVRTDEAFARLFAKKAEQAKSANMKTVIQAFMDKRKVD